MKKKLELLLAAMSKVTGLTKAEIQKKLDFEDTMTEVDFEAAVDEVLDAHATKVDTIKRGGYSEGHKAGKLETMTNLETQLKEKFKVTDSDKKGLALIESIVDASKGKTGDPAQIDEDTVKKHPAYLQLERDSQKALKEAKEEGEKKLKEVTTGLTLKEATDKLVVEGLKTFDDLKPILGETDAAKTKRRGAFEKALRASIKLELADDGEPILLGDDGKRLEDKHGTRKTVKDLVKPLADDLGFEYQTATPRTSSGAGGNDGGAGGQGGQGGAPAAKKFTGTMPAKGDTAAYNKLLADETLSDEAKVEVVANWSELNKT